MPVGLVPWAEIELFKMLKEEPLSEKAAMPYGPDPVTETGLLEMIPVVTPLIEMPIAVELEFEIEMALPVTVAESGELTEMPELLFGAFIAFPVMMVVSFGALEVTKIPFCEESGT